MNPNHTRADARVLAIDELLLEVLKRLDPLSLLRCQRINRRWKAIIDTELSLQQTLFFKPQLISSTKDSQGRKSPGRLNPLLFKAFPGWFNSPGHVLFVAPESFSWIKDDVRRDAYLCPEASWRRMLFCQPPIRTVRIDTISYVRPTLDSSGLSRFDPELSDEDGIQMGPLYDSTWMQAVHHARRTSRDHHPAPRPGFSIWWCGEEIGIQRVCEFYELRWDHGHDAEDFDNTCHSLPKRSRIAEKDPFLGVLLLLYERR
ncbi:hypothetical protein EV356DRAFT_518185 [Viridothelium virens]|uniref:F-box domain-containing protein n=1 Tax=Viridothelium virens TaxID=1048519 RepID=A0A6A6H272_VIRVR|nr:hypothetical protein EV356DRAFT_518185 [Viridothelium virens]